ncbi:MAG TPA: YvcK family protein, partial [Kouleothrix sp.]|nr:YvcK family protein [Kouleothrix sp.]
LAADGVLVLAPSAAELAAIAALDVRPVVRDFGEPSGVQRVLWNKQDTLRHDTAALAAALRELIA